LGLYLSSVEAHDLVRDNPAILFIDVRDPLEIAKMGHPQPVDKVVPIRVQSDLYNVDMDEYTLVPNEKFLEEMELALREVGKSKFDLIILTCGSGYRSAEAVRLLSDAGYTNVWSITDGYEGDEKRGMNLENAWQNAGLPWSTSLVSETPWVTTLETQRQ